MTLIELEKELSMPYDDLVLYLTSKYGPVSGNYFISEDNYSRNRNNVRSSDGLYCHHIMEKKAENLSNINYAIKNPFEWQLAKNLVYCNLIEHLILHLKIMLIRSKFYGCDKQYSYDRSFLINFKTLFNIIPPGLEYICNDLNRMFCNKGKIAKWKIPYYNVISDSINAYLTILKVIIAFHIDLCSNYRNDGLTIIKDSHIKFSGTAYRILSVSDDSVDYLDKKVVLIDTDGNCVNYSYSGIVSSIGSCQDRFYALCMKLASCDGSINTNILNCIYPIVQDNKIDCLLDKLYVDYTGSLN